MEPRNPEIEDREYLNSLRSTALCSDLSEEDFQELAATLERFTLTEGEILFRQGDPGDAMYLVVTGRLVASTKAEDNRETVVGEIGPGEPVGEMHVVAGGTRTADVRAVSDSNLAKLSVSSFKKLSERTPSLAKAVTDMMRRRWRTTQLALILPSLFGPVDQSVLKDVEDQIQWRRLERRQILFRQGDPAGSLFLIVSGRLQAVVTGDDGNDEIVAEIARGESVGEMAVITGESRSATIHAVRDSELVEFSASAFGRIVTHHPQMLMSITRILTDRLRKTTRSFRVPSRVANIALVPAGPDVQLSAFADNLTKALSSLGSTLHLDSERLGELLGLSVNEALKSDLGSSTLSDWLDDQETRYRFIVYEADVSATHWTKMCIHHADEMLIVADASADPTPGDTEAEVLGMDKSKASARRTLVLMHPDGNRLPTGTERWLSQRRVDNHQHVRWDTQADFGRIARFLNRSAVGLVFSGGGARGFAHIGVIEALLEAGVPIDMVGGTSMGSLVSSQYAMGRDHQTMIKKVKEAFVEQKPFSDYTLPMISLIRSRNLDRSLEIEYGDIRIEDLWLNYFCESSNLTTAELVTHQTGLVRNAIRASVSIPGVVAPVIDGDNLLVDGGVLNNLPGDVMRELGAGVVIAVDISADEDLKVTCRELPSPWAILLSKVLPFYRPIEFPSIVEVCMRSTMLSSVNRTHQVKLAADFYLRPPVAGFKILDFHLLEEIAEIGYKYAKEKIEEWDWESIVFAET
jgi:predicted acylesterase/phospholipase RssA/CRP-like cAMP-binding protein